MQARDRLIVALDVPNAIQARQIVQSLGDTITTYKVGKQLFVAEGPQLVRDLVASGRKVFLDLKFHDIPNTVAEAVRSAARLGVTMLNLHASGGSKMMKAAVEAAAQSETKPLVLAVTVLTSLSDADMSEIGFCGTAANQVLRLAALARSAGCGGIISSARETGELRRELGEGFPIVNLGIRMAGADIADHARPLTPGEALAAGATYLGVGRPILQADDPLAAARRILAEMEEALQSAAG
jgi:orotidine-5'-phosphate decarboxylase